MKQKKILFVCKHNIFRSRVAEEYMKKISKNNWNVSSAGLIPGEATPAVQQNVAQELYGLKIPYKPQALTIPLLWKQDKIIVVASDIPKEVFNNPVYKLDGKLEFWNIHDAQNLFEPEENNVKDIIKAIAKKVEALDTRLKEEAQ